MRTPPVFPLANVSIRRINLKDARAFFDMIERNRDHLKLYFPRTLNQLKDLDTTKALIREKTTEHKQAKSAYFVVRINRKLVGAAIAHQFDWVIPKCEIAYFIDKDYQGRGVTTEAIRQLISYCFDNLQMEKICARVNPSNIASKQVVIKNGFCLEGILAYDFRDGLGRLNDSEYYGLIKSKRL